MDPRNSLDSMAVVTSSFLVDDILNRREENTDGSYENRIAVTVSFSTQGLNFCASAPMYSYGDRRTTKEYETRLHDEHLSRHRASHYDSRESSFNFEIKDLSHADVASRGYEELSCMVAEAERKAENARHVFDQPNETSKISFISSRLYCFEQVLVFLFQFWRVRIGQPNNQSNKINMLHKVLFPRCLANI